MSICLYGSLCINRFRSILDSYLCRGRPVFPVGEWGMQKVRGRTRSASQTNNFILNQGLRRKMPQRPLVGYRIPTFQESGVTDPVSIALYERRELGNHDIQDTLHWRKHIKNATIREAISYLQQKKNEGYTAAVWVCRTARDVITYYSDHDEQDEIIPPDWIEKWVFRDYVIISDVLGDEGVLVMYRPASTSSKMIKVRESHLPNKREIKPQKWIVQYLTNRGWNKEGILQWAPRLSHPNSLAHYQKKMKQGMTREQALADTLKKSFGTSILKSLDSGY